MFISGVPTKGFSYHLHVPLPSASAPCLKRNNRQQINHCVTSILRLLLSPDAGVFRLEIIYFHNEQVIWQERGGPSKYYRIFFHPSRVLMQSRQGLDFQLPFLVTMNKYQINSQTSLYSLIPIDCFLLVVSLVSQMPPWVCCCRLACCSPSHPDWMCALSAFAQTNHCYVMGPKSFQNADCTLQFNLVNVCFSIRFI